MIRFPDNPAEMLAWAHLVATWCLLHYLRNVVAPRRSRRAWLWPLPSLAMAAAPLVLFGLGLTSGLAALVSLVASILLRASRRSDQLPNDAVEGLAVVLAPALLALPVGCGDLTLRVTLLTLPTSPQRIVDGLLIGAAFLVVTRGGTLFVRGLLQRLRQERTATDANSQSLLIQPPELAAGRVIGELERALLLLLVLDGSFAAAGFLVAAKGFLRVRDSDDRAFAEYVIVGTLASFLFAAGVAAWTRLAVS